MCETRARAGVGPSRASRPARSLFRRVVFRRQFYLQLVKILADRARSPAREGRIFLSLMGSVGDLVYLFPSLEVLARRSVLDMGTGGYPYLPVVKNNPHVARIYSPFIYKPRRRAQRRLIERMLSPFYERVLLLEFDDGDWWKEGRHFAERYAEACGCPAPRKGIVYLSEDNRRAAAEYLRRHGLSSFVYVVQMVRHRLPFRSWPSRITTRCSAWCTSASRCPSSSTPWVPTPSRCRISAWTPGASTC